MALPTLYPQLNAPARNLAAAFDVPTAIPTPLRRQYMAADGTPIGYGNTCDPITAEMGLSELEAWYDITEYVPEAIQEKRVTWMESFSMPLVVAAVGYGMGARPAVTAALSAASYMAPYPVALFVAWRAAGPRLRARMATRRGRNVRTGSRAPRRQRTAAARRNVRR
ncbi:MAG: hypothetical protein ACE10O_00930 [Candidatus Acidiferrales bacterium]